MFFCGFGLFTNYRSSHERVERSGKNGRMKSAKGKAFVAEPVEGLKGKNSMQHVPANERERERVRGH
jgi:hypothetical protein